MIRRLFLFLALAAPACAQLSVVGSPVSAELSGANQSLSLGAAPAVGNVVVALCSNYSSQACAGTTLGWTFAGSSPVNGGTIGSSVYYRFAQSGDSGAYLFNPTSMNDSVTMIQVHGADAVYPITSSTFANHEGTTTSASVTTPAVTPAVNRMLGLAFLGRDSNDAAPPTGITSSGWTYYQGPRTHGWPYIDSGILSALTSGTTSPVNATFSLTAVEIYGVASWTILINPAGTSGLSPSTLTMSASPTSYTAANQTVALSATASPSSATGTITFTDSTTSTTLGTCTLASGTCSITTTAIPQGANSIGAAYGGSGTLGPSSAAPVTVSNNNPIPYVTTSQVAYVTGTAVEVQTYITPASATGTLTVSDGGTTIGSCTVATFAGKGDPWNAPTHTGCVFPGITLAAGTHTLTSAYSGDGTYPARTSASYVNIVSAVATSPQPCSAMTLGLNGSLGGFIPAINDAYHQRIDGLPADPNSAAIIADWGISTLHHDFDNSTYGYSGIPYYVVDSSVTPGLSFGLAVNGGEYYPGDSDYLTTWPGATNTMWIENHYSSPQTDLKVGVNNGDDHLNLLDRATCTDSETYHTEQLLGQTPALTAASSAIWDMSGRAVPQIRAVGTTSTEAGGLSVFEGLIRYDEVAAGVISHATRYQTNIMNCDHFRQGDCQSQFTFPATHTADSGSHSYFQHYGLRVRLKASFDISSFSAANQAILTAWKQYGMILSDVGSRGYFSGTPDSRWNSDDLKNLQYINTSNFEAVEEPTVYAPDRYPAGTAAIITTFTASPSTVASGGAATLTATTNGASYNVIDGVGFFGSNSVSTTIYPTATKTYTLTSTNQFLAADDGFEDGHRNTATATVTVTVSRPIPAPFISGSQSTGGQNQW